MNTFVQYILGAPTRSSPTLISPSGPSTVNPHDAPAVPVRWLHTAIRVAVVCSVCFAHHVQMTLFDVDGKRVPSQLGMIRPSIYQVEKISILRLVRVAKLWKTSRGKTRVDVHREYKIGPLLVCRQVRARLALSGPWSYEFESTVLLIA